MFSASLVEVDEDLRTEIRGSLRWALKQPKRWNDRIVMATLSA